MKLSTRMVAIAVLAVLVTAGSLVAVSTRASEAALAAVLDDWAANLAHNVMASIDRLVYERFRDVNGWATLDVMRAVDQPGGDLEGSLTAFLSGILENSPFYEFLLVAKTSIDGDSVEAATRPDLIGKPVPPDFWTNDNPAIGLSDRVYVGDVQKYPGSSRPSVILRGALYLGREPVGVLIALLKPSALGQIVPSVLGGEAGSELGRRVSVLVTNRSGALVTGYGPFFDERKIGEPVPLLAGIKGAGGAFARDGDTYRVFRALSRGYDRYPGLGWRCHVILGAAEITAPLRRLATRLLAAGGLAAAVCALLIGLTMRSAFRPLNEIVEHMHSVGEGRDLRLPAFKGSGEIARLHTAYLSMLSGLIERNRIHSAFSRYVSPVLAARIVSAEEAVGLSGVEAEVTVMFMDVRGYTKIAERLPAPAIVAALNDYFSLLVDIIFRHEGTLDKYIGDCIMAVWGAPIAQPDHALRACRAALEIPAALAAFDARRRAEGLEILEFGLGLASGTVVAGNIGSEQRLEYTVIGDPVNVAARVESMTRQFDRPALAAGTTIAAAGDRVIASPLGAVPLKGRKESMELYEITGIRNDDPTA